MAVTMPKKNRLVSTRNDDLVCLGLEPPLAHPIPIAMFDVEGRRLKVYTDADATIEEAASLLRQKASSPP
jgi:hypothetical protein